MEWGHIELIFSKESFIKIFRNSPQSKLSIETYTDLGTIPKTTNNIVHKGKKKVIKRDSKTSLILKRIQKAKQIKLESQLWSKEDVNFYLILIFRFLSLKLASLAILIQFIMLKLWIVFIITK